MQRNLPRPFKSSFWLDSRRKRDWVRLVCLLVLGLGYPIRTTTSRTACVILVVLVWALGLLVFRSKPARFLFVGLLVWILAIAFLPGRGIDSNGLRTAYVNALRSYSGVKYVWGGENGLGIDCSGLVRQGMIDATFRQGVLTSNPGLIRQSFSIWWHDSSAERLGAGYGGRLLALRQTPSLSTFDYSTVRPGDVAVTVSGEHTLAYVGHQTWIEADPGDYAGRVIQVTVPGSRNPWLDTPMRILRWRLLRVDPTPAG